MSRRRCPDNHPWMLDLGEGVTVLCGALRRSDAARLRTQTATTGDDGFSRDRWVTSQPKGKK